MDYMAMNIGQAAMDTIVVIDQVLVIDSKEMKDRRMEVMPSDRIAGHFPADIVRLAIGEPWPQSCARHPGRKRIAIMISSWSSHVRG